MWPQSLRVSAERDRYESARGHDNRDVPPPPDKIVIEYTSARELSINHQQVLVVDLEHRLRAVFEERVAVQ